MRELTKMFSAVIMSLAIGIPEAQSAPTPIVGTNVAGDEKSYIILDKKASRITVVENGKVLLTTPVLTGKKEADEIGVFGATPVGKFPLSVFPSDSEPGTTLGFFCDTKNLCLVIHSVIESGIRERFLNSATTADNQQTMGCGAVLLPAYRQLESFVKRNSDPEKGKWLYLMILPKNHDNIPQYFPNFKP